MASIDRYRPTREGYQPPSLPQAPKPPSQQSGAPPPAPTAAATSTAPPHSQGPDRPSHSPSAARRRDVPPPVPSPPTHTSRTSPPRPPYARKDAAASVTSPQKHHHHQPPAPQPISHPPFASQWYYTEEELVSTPSVLDGLSPAEERGRRAKGVNFIYQAGIAVQPHSLPQMTLYVAAVFFHRFYQRISMVEERGGIHHYKIAATALFLANKTEENCFKTKNLIIAVAKVAQKNANFIVDEQSKEYWRWRDSILTSEELMLETLTFDLMVPNPYDQLWTQLRKLDQLPCKPIREAAWTFLNDAALTMLPLHMDASDIASASIFFASVVSREKIDDIHGEPWWRVLRADQGRLARAVHMMVAFYTENLLKKQNDRLQGSPVFSLETTRRAHELSTLNNNGNGGGSARGPGSGQLEAGLASRDVTPMELDNTQASTTTQNNSSNGNGGKATQSQTLVASQTTTESDWPVLSQQQNGSDKPNGRGGGGDKGDAISYRPYSPEKRRKSPDLEDDTEAQARQPKRVRPERED